MTIKQILSLIATAVLIIATSVVITLDASGYRLDFQSGAIQGTGILSISSTPDGALVYINDVPKDATDTSIPELKPGRYTVRLEKEGYAPWTSEVEVRKELVTEINALLVPLYPSLKPLTFTGASHPIPSPDNQKIVYQVQSGQSAGIWFLSLEDRPFNLTHKPQPIILDTEDILYSQARLTWSPHSNQLLIEPPNQESNNPSTTGLYDFNTNTFRTLPDTQTLLEDWATETKQIQAELVANLPSDAVEKIATLEQPLWSPDSNWILHLEKNNDQTDYYIYPVVNNPIDRQPPTTQPTPYIDSDKPLVSLTNPQHKVTWFPDSRHLIITQQTNSDVGTVEIIDITGTNRNTLFSGQIGDLLAVPSSAGSRVIVLAKFNLQTDAYNLYAINLQ